MGRLPRARGLVARHITLLCALALLLATAGCGGQRQLHIALHPWIGYETLTLAADLDWLPPSVVLQRGASVSDSLQALREGRVQAAAVTLDEALRLCAGLPSLQVVLVMDESAGADALVANPAIEDLAALAGRRVAYEDSAVTKLLLHGALARAGLLPGDIEGVDLTVDRHLPAYREGRIDASVSYQPHTQDLLAAGAVRLFDSRDLPGMILDVLVVDSRALGRRRALLRQVVAAHFRALRYLRSSPDDEIGRASCSERVCHRV